MLSLEREKSNVMLSATGPTRRVATRIATRHNFWQQDEQQYGPVLHFEPAMHRHLRYNSSLLILAEQLLRLEQIRKS